MAESGLDVIAKLISTGAVKNKAVSDICLIKFVAV